LDIVLYFHALFAAALHRNLNLCNPRKGIARPRPNFNIHVSVIDLYIYSHVRYSSAAQFFSWEYLFRIFGIVPLHCTPQKCAVRPSNVRDTWCALRNVVYLPLQTISLQLKFTKQYISPHRDFLNNHKKSPILFK
jgi:hypothetical protein